MDAAARLAFGSYQAVAVLISQAVIGISRLGDASVVISVCPWVKVDEFGPAGAELNRAILAKLQEASVAYPAPSPEIRLVSAT